MRLNRTAGLRLLLTVAAMGGVLTVAACEGENLFVVPDGPGGLAGSDTKPPVVAINSPRQDSLSAKPIGDSVLVSVHVTDDVGLRSVRMFGIAHRGDKNLGTNVVVARFREKTITLGPAVKDTTLTRFLLPTPDSVKETSLIVVEAQDTAGHIGSDTVALILGGPDVELLDITNGQTIQAGLNLGVRMRAQDPTGIIELRVNIAGAFAGAIVKKMASAVDSVVLDTVVVVPKGITGSITVTATARNSLDIWGQDGPLTLNVVAVGAGDTVAPRLSQLATTPSVDRMESQDRFTLQVTGGDNQQGSGVAKVGYTILAISPTRGDTVVRTDSLKYAPSRTGTLTATFSIPTFNVDSLGLPDTLVFEITTWMQDVDGNCGASTGAAVPEGIRCGVLPGGQRSAAGRTGQRLTRTIVAGKTVRLPTGGRIMDAAVDTARRKLFLSNIRANRLEVFDLQSETFSQAIGVGSEPWGLALTRDRESLWVANSGGTNLSLVDLDTEQEVDDKRFLTPDVALFEIEVRTSDAGIQLLIYEYPTAKPPSFSDRPQYVAVDSFSNLIYSTKTTSIGNLGTVRKGYFEDGWNRSEAKIFIEHGTLEPQPNIFALAHIDSIAGKTDTVGVDTLGKVLTESHLTLFDHVPGFPDQIITGASIGVGVPAIDSALAKLRNGGSDVFAVYSAKWNLASLGFKDETYVASSGDGGWVAVGEGGAAPVGRVLSYGARPLEGTALSRSLQVADLLSNPAEEVRGIGLNYDGSLGVVRGRFAAYFFSPADLRLQGLTEIPLAAEGSGAALHPLHANFRTLDNLGGKYTPDTHLAFVASGQRTVDIIDTQRYTRIGRLYIRDNIAGPLRAVLPFDPLGGGGGGDNTEYRCATLPVQDKRGNTIGKAVQLYEGGDFLRPIARDGITEDRCIVMKLFATTDAGGVVVIDVRKADVLKEHPARD